MPVYNLGNYGQPRPSALSGLSDALAQGAQAGAQLRDVKSKEAYYKLQRDQLESKEKKERLERAEHIATQLTTMDEAKRAQFLLTNNGQQILKEIKKDVPWAFDDGGQFIGVSNEKVFETTKKIRDEKLDSMKAELFEKVKAGQALAPEEEKLAEMFRLGNDELLRQANDRAMLEVMSEADQGTKNAWSEENIIAKQQKHLRILSGGQGALPPQAAPQMPQPPQNSFTGAIANTFSGKPATAATPTPQSTSSEKKSYQSLWS